MIDHAALDRAVRTFVSIKRMRTIVEDVDEYGEDITELICQRMPEMYRRIRREYWRLTGQADQVRRWDGEYHRQRSA